MPRLACLGQRPPGLGQKNRPVGAGFNKVLALQSLDDGVDCRAGDTESRRQIDGARLACLGNQIGNHLDIILGHLGLVRPPDTVEFRRTVGDIRCGLAV